MNPLRQTRLAYEKTQSILHWAVASSLTGMLGTTAIAQTTPSRFRPQSLAVNPRPERYNLRWGDLRARFTASAQTEVTDNIGLSDDDPQTDIGFGPNLDVGLYWPLTQANLLQLDLGFGYRWYIHNPSIQSIQIAPESHLDYAVYFEHGNVRFHDDLGVDVNPTSRPDLSSSTTTEKVEEFRRIQNSAGLTAEWNPVSHLSLLAGYSFELDRSLSGEFTDIDRNSHQFNLGGFYSFDAPMTAGLRGTFSTTDYLENFHNDNHSYSLAPLLFLQPSRYITVEASAGYSVSSFDSSGSILDDSEFEGFTGQLGIEHKLNRYISHELRFSKSFQLGLESNFYELLSIHYSLSLALAPKITLQPAIGYEHYRNSGPIPETADRYLAQLRTGYSLGRRWSIGAAYGFTSKNSDRPGGDYIQNRFTIDLTHHF